MGRIAQRPTRLLRPADALTLHHLARHGAGDALELGSAWGLSATLLCRGVRARGWGRTVSVEVDTAFQAATVRAIRAAGLGRWHRMVGGDAGQVLAAFVRTGRRFGTVFVDHDHGLDATRRICALLPRLLLPEGMALFHDFNDPRNGTGEYGVHQGVCEMLDAQPGLVLFGQPGCCALVGQRP